MIVIINFVGLSIAAASLAAIIFSALYPARRIWPPQSYGPTTKAVVWALTLTLFGALIALGVLGWGNIAAPQWLRFGAGPLLIVLGNLIVWREVTDFGIDQTSGASGTLKTTGLYRLSLNPQYVADIAIVLGWLLLSASIDAVAVGLAIIALLVAAPFAEEPWLREEYGDEYARYTEIVRRYL